MEIKKGQDEMEYYIYITKDCNLSCKYCCGQGIRKAGMHGLSKPKNIRKIAEYVLSNMNAHEDEYNNVVFYGGEPLLNQGDIKRFIDLTDGCKNIKYCLYTNGMILDKMDDFLLNKIDYLFVSIDGEQAIHDQYRGVGTFEKIVSNIHKVKPKFKGEIIARLTITSETSVSNAVLSLVEWFDHIFWQLESSPDTSNLDQFKIRYKQDILALIQYWTKNIKMGVVKNIVPFQAIVSSILSNRQHYNLRCGCGTNLRVIDDIDSDIDNETYMCDELLGTKEFIINGKEKPDSKRWSCEELNSYCGTCDIKLICGGRCLKSLLFYPREKFLFYCDLTKFTIANLRNIAVPVIKKCLSNPGIKFEDLNTYVANHCTEEIP